MSEVSKHRAGRHRAPVRPVTPLAGLSFSKVKARRGVMTMASSSLALTMAASSAAAAPESSTTQAQPRADVAAITEAARAALVSTPEVSTSADVSWSVQAASAEATPPPPPPEPEPEPVVERTTEVSRDTVREDLAAETTVEATAEVAAEAAPEPEPEPAPPVSASSSAIVNIARQYIGTPYVYGGASPAGFDCSGFTQYVFAQVGISLPRSSDAQRYAGTVVSAAEARPGDLVWGPGHVGIYTGNGQHIAARNPSTPLYESPIYLSNPVFIRVA